MNPTHVIMIGMTCTIIPISVIAESTKSACFLELSMVSAGFPSPADDHLDNVLDLNELLIKHPAATFLVRVDGKSMRGIGIFDNDILVVDRSEKVINGSVVVAAVNGECLVKTYHSINGRTWLQSAHPHYPPLYLSEGTEFHIWGVVAGVVRKHGSNGRVCSD